MALLFLDGFDHSYYKNKYKLTVNNTNSPIGPNTMSRNVDCKYGSTSGSGNSLTAYLDKQCKTVIVGVAIYTGSLSGWGDLITIRPRYLTSNMSGPSLYFYNYLQNLSFSLKTVDNTLGSYTVSNIYNPYGLFWYSGWNYFEVKTTLDNSNGSVELRINGTPVILNSHCASAQSADYEYADSVVIGETTYTTYYDDLYICDDSGDYNNDYMNELRIDGLKPNGAGNYTQWTPSSGSNYTCVDEIPNSEIDYISTTTFDNKDSYTFYDIPITDYVLDTLKAVTQNFTARKHPDSNYATITPFVRLDSVDYFSSTHYPLNDIWQNYQHIWEKNPATNALWTKTEINAAEFGTKLYGLS